MKRKSRKICIVNIIIGLLLINSAYASDILVSSKRLYPVSIKTPKDIGEWFIKAGFTYQKDKNSKDGWKTPKRTVKDKGGDCEDFAILASHILKDLGYKEVAIWAICFRSKSAHAICVFKEKNGTYSFFTNVRYRKTGMINPLDFVDYYYPLWRTIVLCTESGTPKKFTPRRRRRKK